MIPLFTIQVYLSVSLREDVLFQELRKGRHMQIVREEQVEDLE